MFQRSRFKKIQEKGVEFIQLYSKQQNKFSSFEQEEIRQLFQTLDEAVAKEDTRRGGEILKILEERFKEKLSFNPVQRSIQWLLALGVALFVATVIRQLVFEPYEIPSGSMRPTFREGDHLVASKTTFGINAPFQAGHLLFDPERVLRGGFVTFTGEGVDLPDTDARYFWIFPGKKRYIKRLIGKPGDTLTFYGGQIFGLDRDGKQILDFEGSLFGKLDHIPFNSFEQKVSRFGFSGAGEERKIIFYHFNQPIGRLILSRSGFVRGEVFDGKKWVAEDLQGAKVPHHGIKAFSDWFGLGNFGQVRLVPPKAGEEGLLTLEISHHPHLAPLTRLEGLPPLIGPLPTFKSRIPLPESLLQVLAHHLYTARFSVQDGMASRVGVEGSKVALEGVPNGVYEFYDGIASKIGWGGVSSSLPEEHPLNNLTPNHLQILFNLGIEFSPIFDPSTSKEAPFPSRFATFRDGDLWVMGSLLLKKEEAELDAFIAREKIRSQKEKTYLPFLDYGRPDALKIEKTGFRVPEKHYIVLGDNYAMSSDSRSFGAIPEGNLEGSPLFVFWPFQERAGFSDSLYPFWNPYGYFMWALFLFSIYGYSVYEKKKRLFPLTSRLKSEKIVEKMGAVMKIPEKKQSEEKSGRG